VSITNEIIGISQLLGGGVPVLPPPKVYAYVSQSLLVSHSLGKSIGDSLVTCSGA